MKSDAAEAARVFAKQQGLSQETIRYATEIRLDAERKLGAILRDAPKRGPEHPSGGGSSGGERVPLPDAPPTLADLGIIKNTSVRAQKLAELSDATFEKINQKPLQPKTKRSPTTATP